MIIQCRRIHCELRPGCGFWVLVSGSWFQIQLGVLVSNQKLETTNQKPNVYGRKAKTQPSNKRNSRMAAFMEQLAIMSDRSTEAETIKACKRGDRAAFRDLFEAHKDRIYTIAFHYGGDEATARDVTQQVFLKLFSVIGQFREDSQFTTWLYRIVANVCADEHRKRRRFVPFSPAIEVSHMTTRSTQEES